MLTIMQKLIYDIIYHERFILIISYISEGYQWKLKSKYLISI